MSFLCSLSVLEGGIFGPPGETCCFRITLPKTVGGFCAAESTVVSLRVGGGDGNSAVATVPKWFAGRGAPEPLEGGETG